MVEGAAIAIVFSWHCNGLHEFASERDPDIQLPSLFLTSVRGGILNPYLFLSLHFFAMYKFSRPFRRSLKKVCSCPFYADPPEGEEKQRRRVLRGQGVLPVMIEESGAHN